MCFIIIIPMSLNWLLKKKKHFKVGVVSIVFIQRNKDIYGWERQLRLSRLIILFERKYVTPENLLLAVGG